MLHTSPSRTGMPRSLGERFRRWLRERGSLTSWLAERDIVVYLALFAVLWLTYLFLVVADAVRQETPKVDLWVIRALRADGAGDDPIGPAWFEEMWLDVSALGSETVTGMLALGAVAYSMLVGRRRLALAVLIAMAGAVTFILPLKGLFARPRPDFMARFVEATNPGFPSGHSLLAAVVYPAFGGLCAQLSERVRIRLFVMSAALLVTLLVGFSRVYLGLHYPSDVLAGWCIGLSWAIICWLGLRRAERRAAARVIRR